MIRMGLSNLFLVHLPLELLAGCNIIENFLAFSGEKVCLNSAFHSWLLNEKY